MSQDMMQALSGSSLLSLSIGTLPAGKSGMTLDANPFASQLALMTGSDAAVAGMAAPVAASQAEGEGAFAAALADIGESAPAAKPSGDPAASALPEMAMPHAAPEAPVIVALPEGASTSQVIEAALTGAASLATAPQTPETPRTAAAATLPVTDTEGAPVAQQPAAQPSLTVLPLPHASQVPHLRNLIRADAPMPIRAQIAPEAEPEGTETATLSAPTPHAAAEPADKAPTSDASTAPIAPVAIAPVMPQTPAPRPNAPVTDLDTTGIAAEAAPAAPRRSAEPQAASASPERPMLHHGSAPHLARAPQDVQPGMASAPGDAVVPVSQPEPAAPLDMRPATVTPDAAANSGAPMAVAQTQAAPAPAAGTAPAPEAPHERQAIDARDSGDTARIETPEAPRSDKPREVRDTADLAHGRSLETPPAQPGIATAPASAPVTPAPAPATSPIAARAASTRNVAAPIQPAAPRAVVDQPAASDFAASAPVAPSAIEAQPSAPTEARQAPAPVVAAPAQPVAAAAPNASSHLPPPAAHQQTASAPLASTDSASVLPAQSPAVTTGTTAQPAPADAAPVESRQQAPVQQASAPQMAAPAVPAAAASAPDAARAAQAAPIAMAAPVQSPAPRAQVSPAARRTIDTALQSPRAAEPLAALFDRADLTVQTGISSLAIEPLSPASIEAVPPAWAAALNAVNPQVQQASGAAAPQAAAQPQVPMHNLAFDAGFVAGIEGQIAKLVDGGQMVKIQVMPEHLGRIDIEMLAGPDRDQVRIVTEHDAVRDTLVSSQHRLEQDLRSQGQRNTEVTVELRQQSPGTQNGSAQQQQQRGQSGAESASARDAAQRQTPADQTSDANPAPRRPRGNVRYA